MKVVNIIIIHNTLATATATATPITIMSVHKQYIGYTYTYSKNIPTEDDEFLIILIKITNS